MISYLDINELNIDKISSYVSEKRLERASKLKHEKDKLRSIAVEYLLNTMVEEIQGNDDDASTGMIQTPVELEYDEHGKPHLYINEEKDEEIYFSLSHSGDYVACMIADKTCGIDIERHSDREYEKIAKRICSESEINNIKNKEDFYKIWTLKESVMKAEGLGLALDMRKITCSEIIDGHSTIMVGNKKYYGFCVEAPAGYSLSYVF